MLYCFSHFRELYSTGTPSSGGYIRHAKTRTCRGQRSNNREKRALPCSKRRGTQNEVVAGPTTSMRKADQEETMSAPVLGVGSPTLEPGQEARKSRPVFHLQSYQRKGRRRNNKREKGVRTYTVHALGHHNTDSHCGNGYNQLCWPGFFQFVIVLRSNKYEKDRPVCALRDRTAGPSVRYVALALYLGTYIV